MHYHIILTELCNSKCKYCYEKSMNEFDNGLEKKFHFDFSSPASSKININKLKKFLDRDKNPVLIFYGGEPLLEIKKIKEIIDRINVPFRMQTNAKLLDKISPSYLNKIGKILVSIDGTEERTDFNKGPGTHKKIIENVKLARKNGYKGEIVARMVISPNFPDIYEQALHLLNRGLFDSIHWQIDAGFYKSDFYEEKFSKFVKEYNKSISKLINYWIEKIKEEKVLKLYPFLGIVDSLLKKEKNLLRCGAGHLSYAITTKGGIVACPIMNGIKEFEAGDLDSSPNQLKKFEISGKCRKCEIKDVCGGRCLYWNKTELWPEKGNNLICETIFHLIKEIKSKIPKINSLIKEGKIKKSDFEYEKHFGPEIIP